MNDIKSIRFPSPAADEMVQAILDGRKSVTRRVVKPQPEGKPYPMPQCSCWPGYFGTMESARIFASSYRPGDILYVRERWRVQCAKRFDAEVRIEFYAGGPMTTIKFQRREEFDAFVNKWVDDKWHPSIHMPKEAARLFLRVTDVRVERLRDMQPYDIAFEGFRRQRDFVALWDSTIKKADLPLYGWEANPWVWVIEFERISKEEVLKGGDVK